MKHIYYLSTLIPFLYGPGGVLGYEGQLLGPIALRLPVIVSIEAVLPSKNYPDPNFLQM